MVKFVLKPGFYEKKRTGKNQPGLDLWRVTLDTLVDRSLAVTTDCCNYYPTAPTIYVADRTAPTEAEMENVPPKGFFFAQEEGNITWNLFVKVNDTQYEELAAFTD